MGNGASVLCPQGHICPLTSWGGAAGHREVPGLCGLLPSLGLRFPICTLGGGSLSSSQLVLVRVEFTEVLSAVSLLRGTCT